MATVRKFKISVIEFNSSYTWTGGPKKPVVSYVSDEWQTGAAAATEFEGLVPGIKASIQSGNEVQVITTSKLFEE